MEETMNLQFMKSRMEQKNNLKGSKIIMTRGKRKNWRKLLSALLIMSMLLGTMGTSAFAADSTEAPLAYDSAAQPESAPQMSEPSQTDITPENVPQASEPVQTADTSGNISDTDVSNGAENISTVNVPETISQNDNTTTEAVGADTIVEKTPDVVISFMESVNMLQALGTLTDANIENARNLYQAAMEAYQAVQNANLADYAGVQEAFAALMVIANEISKGIETQDSSEHKSEADNTAIQPESTSGVGEPSQTINTPESVSQTGEENSKGSIPNDSDQLNSAEKRAIVNALDSIPYEANNLTQYKGAGQQRIVQRANNLNPSGTCQVKVYASVIGSDVTGKPNLGYWPVTLKLSEVGNNNAEIYGTLFFKGSNTSGWTAYVSWTCGNASGEVGPYGTIKGRDMSNVSKTNSAGVSFSSSVASTTLRVGTAYSSDGKVVDDGKGVSITKTRNSINDDETATTAKAGDEIQWNIKVTNNSNVKKTVQLTEKLVGATLNKDSVTLEAGKSETVSATYTVTGKEELIDGKLFNTVAGTTGGKGDKENPEDTDDGTDIGIEDNGEGVSITKTRISINGDKTATTAEAGDEIKWNIKVTNNSNVEKTVELTEKLTGAALSKDSITLEAGVTRHFIVDTKSILFSQLHSY